VVFNYDFGLRWLFLSLFSVDGGPLTDNVVLSSVQRVLVLKRTAELLVYSGSFACEAELAFAKQRLTARSATACVSSLAPFLLLPKAALRPGVIFASIASPDASPGMRPGPFLPSPASDVLLSITSRRSRNLNTIVDQ
jgi:hypothetical protein